MARVGVHIGKVISGVLQAAGAESWPVVPEAGAPEAPAVAREATPDDAP